MTERVGQDCEGASPRGLRVRSLDLTPPWRAARAPIVLHHGLGISSDLWAEWLPVLAPSHPVVRFDTRGFGRSPPIADASGEGLLEVLVEDLMETLGSAPRVHLVGESAGGTVALAAALRHPARIASLTMINAAFAGRGIGQIGGWRRLLEEEGVAGWSRRMMAWRFAPGSLDAAAEAWFAKQQEASGAAAILAVAGMLAAIDFTAQLATLRPPLLVLAPGESPFVSLDMARALHARVAGSELRVFEHVRHGLPFSHAAACARATLEFVRRLER